VNTLPMVTSRVLLVTSQLPIGRGSNDTGNTANVVWAGDGSADSHSDATSDDLSAEVPMPQRTIGQSEGQRPGRDSSSLPTSDRRRRRWLEWSFAIAVVMTGCGGKHDSGAPEPVEECKQYEVAVNRCLHRNIDFASQPSLLPATAVDRERIRAVCSENLQRIQKACR
jgi:hypothetical protein